MNRVNTSTLFGVAYERKSRGEKNDCAVMALAVAEDCSYADAHDFMRSELERKDKEGVSIKLIRKTFDVLYERAFQPGRTIRTVARGLTAGRYFVIATGHACAIVDGVIFDNLDKDLKQVWHIWRVK